MKFFNSEVPLAPRSLFLNCSEDIHLKNVVFYSSLLFSNSYLFSKKNEPKKFKCRYARLFPFVEQMRGKAGVDLKITTCETCRKRRLLFPEPYVDYFRGFVREASDSVFFEFDCWRPLSLPPTSGLRR